VAIGHLASDVLTQVNDFWVSTYKDLPDRLKHISQKLNTLDQA